MSSHVDQVRENWGAVIQATLEACRGNPAAAAQLGPFLDEMEKKPDWQNLAGALRRILAGERDPLQVLRGLDETDTLIAGDVLRGLGVDVPIAGADEKEGDDGQMMSLADFVQMAGLACKPDAPEDARNRMLAATLGMATQPNAAPEVRELGRVLNLILSGERNPDLSELPPSFAAGVMQMLETLG